MSLEKWAEKLTKDVYDEWNKNYSKWNPGFKIFYSPVYKNPKIMILSYNPGGNTASFESEDHHRYRKGDFSVQRYHSYSDTNRTLAKAMQRFFSDKDLLSKTIPIPIIFFRSKNVRYWKREFDRIYSEEKREQVEEFCFRKVREILEIIQPRSILIIGTKTYDKLKKSTILELGSEHTKTEKYGNREERIYIKAKWRGKPVFCIRHLSGARTKRSDLTKMRNAFFDMLK